MTYLNEDLHRRGDFGHGRGPPVTVLPAIEWPLDFDDNTVVMVPAPPAQVRPPPSPPYIIISIVIVVDNGLTQAID